MVYTLALSTGRRSPAWSRMIGRTAGRMPRRLSLGWMLSWHDVLVRHQEYLNRYRMLAQSVTEREARFADIDYEHWTYSSHLSWSS